MNNHEDIPILVCVPVDALPTPGQGSVKSVCQKCERPVWVSVESMKFLGKNPKIYIACNNCAIDIIGAENFTDEKAEFRVVPGAPAWTHRALKRLRRRDDIADLLRVKDLDEPEDE